MAHGTLRHPAPNPAGARDCGSGEIRVRLGGPKVDKAAPRINALSNVTMRTAATALERLNPSLEGAKVFSRFIAAVAALTMALAFGSRATESWEENRPIRQSQQFRAYTKEEIFLNAVMIRAYDSGDMASLQELLQYWQDEHSPTI